MQAIISFVRDGTGVGTDELRSIRSGGHLAVFLNRDPIHLVAVSAGGSRVGALRGGGEGGVGGGARVGFGVGVGDMAGGRVGDGFTARVGVVTLRRQLHFLHLQLVSLLTAKFEDAHMRSAGFDLRSLLGGADCLLRGAIRVGSRGAGVMLRAIPALRMPPHTRAQLGKLLLSERPPQVLFAMLVSRGRLVQASKKHRDNSHTPRHTPPSL